MSLTFKMTLIFDSFVIIIRFSFLLLSLFLTPLIPGGDFAYQISGNIGFLSNLILFTNFDFKVASRLEFFLQLPVGKMVFFVLLSAY